MATWTRDEKITTVIQYIIPANEPWGADWNQVQLALGKAVNEYRAMYDNSPFDNSIRVHPRDDEIVIEFEKRN